MKKNGFMLKIALLLVISVLYSCQQKSSGQIDAQKEATETEQKQEENQPKENPDVEHFVGDYYYSYFIGNTNAKLYFKLSLKADGSFTLEPTNEQTKNWITTEKVVDGSDYPDGGDWEVKDTPAGKGAFLDFDGSWDGGTITYDRNVLEIKNMNGYNLKTKLNYEAPKALPKTQESSEIHSPEAILKRVKEMFGNDDFFSEEYKKAEKELQDYADKYCPGDIVGPDYIVWYTSQGGCGEGKTEFGDVQDITESTATIKVFNKFDCDDDHNIVLHLIFEKGNWYVDDISNCFTKSVKSYMKRELENIKK